MKIAGIEKIKRTKINRTNTNVIFISLFTFFYKKCKMLKVYLKKMKWQILFS